MNWKIYDFKPLDKNTLKGIFTLQVGPVEIADMMFHIKNDKSWVNFPSRPYQDKETGETKYASIIRIPDKDSYWRFQAWCLNELKNLEPEKSERKENDRIPF